MMINVHDLSSHSRFAHAQRLSDADKYRLTKLAAIQPESSDIPPQRIRKVRFFDAIATRLRLTRAGV
jgi:hypothetical protein